MIKGFRSLTKLLGKLGFRMYITDHDEIARLRPGWWPRSRLPKRTGKSYGAGLKETKDLVEAYLDRKTRAATTTALSIGVVESKSDPIKPVGMI